MDEQIENNKIIARIEYLALQRKKILSQNRLPDLNDLILDRLP